MIDNTGCMWYRGNELHRVGGPAIDLLDGTQQWWEDGVRKK